MSCSRFHMVTCSMFAACIKLSEYWSGNAVLSRVRKLALLHTRVK